MYDIVIDDEISVWGYGAKKHRENLANLDGDINIFMSSYGGDVYEAIDIFNMNREYSASKGQITITVGSKAMSAGAIITMSADIKKAHSNSTFMIHRAWTFAWGNAVDLEQEAKILNGIDRIQAKAFAKDIGGTEDEMLAILTNDTYYIGKDELEATNIFSEIIDNDETISSQRKETSAYASAKKTFLAKVEENEYVPDLNQTKQAILACSGGECPTKVVKTAVPTVQENDKPVNKIQGENMTDQEIMASKPYTTLVASHGEQVKKLSDEKDTIQTSLNEVNAEVEKQKAWAKQIPEVVAMAMDKGVKAEVMVSMIMAGDMTKAKASLVDGMESGGAFGANADMGGEGSAQTNIFAHRFNNDK